MKITLMILLGFLTVCSAAQENTDSLKAIANKNLHDVPTARSLNLLASRYARTDPALSFQYARRAMKLGIELGHELTQSASLSIFVSYFQNSGNIDSARHYLILLEKLASNASGSDNETVKGNFNSTAGLFYRRIGSLKQALPFFKQTIYYAERADNKIAVAGQSLNLANSYLSLGNYKDALEYYFKALDKFEVLGHREGQSFCLQGIGNSFVELKQFDKGKSYLEKSFHIKQQLGDRKGLITAYKSLGDLDAKKLNFQSAIPKFLKALEHARSLQLSNEQRSVALALGKAYMSINEKGKAEQYLVLSQKLADSSDDELIKSAANIELIALRKTVHTDDSVEVELQSSVAKLESIGYGTQTLAGYLHLADFYKEQGNYKKAYEAKQTYYDVRDSLRGNELTLMLNNLEEKYQSEKKEKEIAQLKRDQVISDTLIREQTFMQYGMVALFIVAGVVGFLIWNRYKLITHAKRRAELEQVRNNIARDLHDDIGSTLSSINILSKVMLDSSSTADTAGLKKIKEHSGNIMESMSDIVWAINPSNDTFEKLVARMREYASEILDPLNIQHHFNVAPSLSQIQIDPAPKKDIFLIVKESVNNAAKHSECSKIEVSIQQVQKIIYLSIADNGKGMNVTNRSGNGLSNIESRAESLSGKAEFKSSPGDGTEILVKFSLT